MVTIAVQANELLVDELAEIAAAKQISLQEAAIEALERYVSNEQVSSKPRYSFIGIGRSGTRNLSQRVEETLAVVAERREGWSLDL
jgi:hypothetical protein